MKRFWIGIALLAVMLGSGIWITIAANRVHGRISDTLSFASQAALKGDWDTAQGKTLEAMAKWERCRKATAAIADHEPMEEIDSLFSQLEVLLQLREAASFSALCARVSVLVRAVGEAHDISWWNLL